jgi:hypothetical protein
MLNQLLGRGYFPRELPSGFSTQSYSNALRSAAGIPSPLTLARPPKAAEVMQHNLARAGRMRRELGIPNPALFFPLAKAISDDWTYIQTTIDECDFSTTRPRLNRSNSGRAILPEFPLGERAALRAKVRAGSRYLLKADISNFYGSIYTHSIPWGLHTRPAAKVERHNDDLLGNRLDRFVRRGQDDQTRGIPTGPDTSLVLAEAVLRRIDGDLQDRLGPLCGFRSVDDYELCFQSLSAAEKCLATLQSVLQQYELDVTALKTDIIPLPHWLDEPWTVPLSTFDLPLAGDSNQKSRILNLFTLVFSLARQNPTASVIKYALRQTQKVTMAPDSWVQYQHILLQCAINESDTLSYVVSELEKYALFDYKVDQELLGRTLNDIVEKEAPVGLGNAVVWALWGLLLFEIPLTSEATAALATLDDAVVAVVALDMRNRGLARDLDVTRWLGEANPEGLYRKNWLLAYEAPAHNWLVPADGDPAKLDEVFDFLRRQEVRFYTPPDSISTRLDQQRYDIEFDLDDSADEQDQTDDYFWNARS